MVSRLALNMVEASQAAHARPAHAPGWNAERTNEDALVEAVARRVVELLREEALVSRPCLVDAATVAERLGVSRAAVYAMADELGARRAPGRARSRLRFDLDQAVAAWTARSVGAPSQAPRSKPASAKRPGRPRRPLTTSAGLLPIRGPEPSRAGSADADVE